MPAPPDGGVVLCDFNAELRGVFMSTIKISQGVGIRQPNKYRDVKTVQSLLNANSIVTSPGNTLKVDGYVGEKNNCQNKRFSGKSCQDDKPRWHYLTSWPNNAQVIW